LEDLGEKAFPGKGHTHDEALRQLQRENQRLKGRKGNCYDNACMESFFANLKQELVYHRQYQTRKEAKQDIFEYIQVGYNRKRRHPCWAT
jgi:transposase InsO family protein